MPLVHQLLKEKDFHEQDRCAYCGNNFTNLDKPQISRYGGAEYITLSCTTGHEHTVSVDISRSIDSKLVHKHIENKRVARTTIEHAVVEAIPKIEVVKKN